MQTIQKSRTEYPKIRKNHNQQLQPFSFPHYILQMLRIMRTYFFIVDTFPQSFVFQFVISMQKKEETENFHTLFTLLKNIDISLRQNVITACVVLKWATVIRKPIKY